MPSNWLYIDTNFPTFTGEENTEEKVATIQNYLFMLVEQLRYSLHNLDTRNMNQTALNAFTRELTEPIYGRIEDAEGNLTELAVTAQGIAARVSDAEGTISSLQMTAKNLTSQIQDANGNISVLQQTATNLTSQIQDANGNISALQQTATSLSSTVANQAGQISAVQQTAASISATVANQAGQISTVTQTVNGLTVSVAGPHGGSTTMINGGNVYTETMRLDRLYGQTIYLYDASGRIAADFGLQGASSYEGQKLDINSGAVEIDALGGYIFLSSNAGGYTTSMQLGGGQAQVAGDLIPNSPSQYSCGNSWFCWTEVYADNDTIVTSDREKKKDIAYDLSAYGAFFDALRPVSYRLVNGQSGRTHLGLIAQDVERAMEDCSLTGMDFAGLIKSPRKGEDGKSGEYDYALRYGEFIPLCIGKIQELTARVAELERKLAQ